MRNFMVALIFAGSPFFAYAQEADVVQRSSSPQGVKIQGDNAQITPGALNSSNISSVSDGNAVNITASTGSSKSSTKIQGNTDIKANARNLNAVASGRSSAAGNEIGAIAK